MSPPACTLDVLRNLVSPPPYCPGPVAPDLVRSPRAPLLDPAPLLLFQSQHPFCHACTLWLGELLFKKWVFSGGGSKISTDSLYSARRRKCKWDPTCFSALPPNSKPSLHILNSYNPSFSQILELDRMFMCSRPCKQFYLDILNALLSLPSLTPSARPAGEQVCMCAHAHIYLEKSSHFVSRDGSLTSLRERIQEWMKKSH